MTLLYYQSPNYLARIDGQLVTLSETEAKQKYSEEQIQKAKDIAWANERISSPIYDGKRYHIRHMPLTRKDAIETLRDYGLTNREAEHVLKVAKLIYELE